MREVVIQLEPYRMPYYIAAILTESVSLLVDDMSFGKPFCFKGENVRLEKNSIMKGFYYKTEE